MCSINRILLSQQMLDNIKHITDDNFFSFSKIAHMCIVCNTIQLSEICDFRVTPVLPGSVEAQAI